GNIDVIKNILFQFKLSSVFAITAGADHTCAITVSLPRCWGGDATWQLGNGVDTGFDERLTQAVDSFTANVDPHVQLHLNCRIATAGVLINCPIGAQAHISLTLQQGQTSGAGAGVVQCTDSLIEVPFNVAAHGPSGFQAGPATASVEAL